MDTIHYHSEFISSDDSLCIKRHRTFRFYSEFSTSGSNYIFFFTKNIRVVLIYLCGEIPPTQEILLKFYLLTKTRGMP